MLKKLLILMVAINCYGSKITIQNLSEHLTILFSQRATTHPLDINKYARSLVVKEKDIEEKFKVLAYLYNTAAELKLVPVNLASYIEIFPSIKSENRPARIEACFETNEYFENDQHKFQAILQEAFNRRKEHVEYAFKCRILEKITN